MSNVSIAAAIDDVCDESKCVALGHFYYKRMSSSKSGSISALHSIFDSPFLCYTDNSSSPMTCSHGYEPHIVETEPVVWSGILDLGTRSSPSRPWNYFTCCPPDLLLPPDVNIHRHCSNTSIVNGTTDVCTDDMTRPYARQMANLGPIESHMCCSTRGNSTSFLNNTECVPFRNDEYSPTSIKNSYGDIGPSRIYCDNNGIYNDFRYPTKTEKTDDSSDHFHYECCKTESTKLPLFIVDSTFKKTVYPQIVVSTIAIFLCLLLIVALLIPLFWNLEKKRKQTRDASTNTNTNRNRRTINNRRTTSTAGTNNNRRGRSTRINNTFVHDLGSYDLYLVYLAIPDLIMNICLLIFFGSMANQRWPDIAKYMYAIIAASSTANLYINCFISREILILLQHSNNIARSHPPSLTKVTIQAMVVYLFSIIVFIANYFSHKSHYESFVAGDYYNTERSKIILKVNLTWSMIVSWAVPFSYFCYVWITIWYKGYLHLSSVTGKMKQLTWYFLRIFVIVNLIWLPGLFLSIFGSVQDTLYSNLMVIGYLFCGIQPIVSFCLAMVKNDVRNDTIALLTLSYIRKACQAPESTTTAVNNEHETAC